MKKNNKKGFTIVELVIVIAVIAILSAVLIPTFTGVVKSAKESAAKNEARNEYMAYVQELDGDIDTETADFIFEDTKNEKFVVILDGKVLDTVYDNKDDACEAVAGEITDTATQEYKIADVTGTNLKTVTIGNK